MADFGVSEIALAAGAVGALGSLVGGASKYQAAQYNAQVANNNAIAAQQQAGYENSLKQIQLEKTIGAQQAAAGASGGVDNQSVTYNSLIMGKYDQLATTYIGNVQATRNQSEAQLDQMATQTALTSGLFGATGDVLSGYANSQRYSQSSQGYGAQSDLSSAGFGDFS